MKADDEAMDMAIAENKRAATTKPVKDGRELPYDAPGTPEGTSQLRLRERGVTTERGHDDGHDTNTTTTTTESLEVLIKEESKTEENRQGDERHAQHGVSGGLALPTGEAEPAEAPQKVLSSSSRGTVVPDAEGISGVRPEGDDSTK